MIVSLAISAQMLGIIFPQRGFRELTDLPVSEGQVCADKRFPAGIFFWDATDPNGSLTFRLRDYNELIGRERQWGLPQQIVVSNAAVIIFDESGGNEALNAVDVIYGRNGGRYGDVTTMDWVIGRSRRVDGRFLVDGAASQPWRVATPDALQHWPACRSPAGLSSPGFSTDRPSGLSQGKCISSCSRRRKSARHVGRREEVLRDAPMAERRYQQPRSASRH